MAENAGSNVADVALLDLPNYADDEGKKNYKNILKNLKWYF